MKWIIGGLALIGLGICAIAWYGVHTAGDPTDAGMSTIFYFPGFFVLILDAIIFAAWRLL